MTATAFNNTVTNKLAEVIINTRSEGRVMHVGDKEVQGKSVTVGSGLGVANQISEVCADPSYAIYAYTKEVPSGVLAYWAINPYLIAQYLKNLFGVEYLSQWLKSSQNMY